MEAGQREPERQGTCKPSLAKIINLGPSARSPNTGRRGGRGCCLSLPLLSSEVSSSGCWGKGSRQDSSEQHPAPQGPETRLVGNAQVTDFRPLCLEGSFLLFCKFSWRTALFLHGGSARQPPFLFRCALRLTDSVYVLSQARPGCQTSTFPEPMDSLIDYASQTYGLSLTIKLLQGPLNRAPVNFCRSAPRNTGDVPLTWHSLQAIAVLRCHLLSEAFSDFSRQSQHFQPCAFYASSCFVKIDRRPRLSDLVRIFKLFVSVVLGIKPRSLPDKHFTES